MIAIDLRGTPRQPPEGRQQGAVRTSTHGAAEKVLWTVEYLLTEKSQRQGRCAGPFGGAHGGFCHALQAGPAEYPSRDHNRPRAPNPNFFFTRIRCEENVGEDLSSRAVHARPTPRDRTRDLESAGIEFFRCRFRLGAVCLGRDGRWGTIHRNSPGQNTEDSRNRSSFRCAVCGFVILEDRGSVRTSPVLSVSSLSDDACITQ